MPWPHHAEKETFVSNRLLASVCLVVLIAVPAVAQEYPLPPDRFPPLTENGKQAVEPNHAPKTVTPQATTTTDLVGSRGTIYVDTDAAGAYPTSGVTMIPAAATPDIVAKLPSATAKLSVLQGSASILTVLGDARVGVNAPAGSLGAASRLTILNPYKVAGSSAMFAYNYGTFTGSSPISEFAGIMDANETITAPVVNTGSVNGARGSAYLFGTGTLATAVGFVGDVQLGAAAGNTGEITEGKAFLARVLNRSGVITRGYGLFIEDVGATTGYGVYQDGVNDSNVFKGAVTVGQPAALSNLTVNGDATFSGTVIGGNIKAKYQDVAEWVPATHDLTPGTVVVLNTSKSNEVMASSVSYDTAVAGVVSDQPGLSLGEEGAGKEQVATTGRVKVRVDARTVPIRVGDLLVTSDVPGTAMRSEPMTINGRRFHQPGTIIGKALEPLQSGMGEILVLLSMQ